MTDSTLKILEADNTEFEHSAKLSAEIRQQYACYREVQIEEPQPSTLKE